MKPYQNKSKSLYSLLLDKMGNASDVGTLLLLPQHNKNKTTQDNPRSAECLALFYLFMKMDLQDKITHNESCLIKPLRKRCKSCVRSYHKEYKRQNRQRKKTSVRMTRSKIICSTDKYSNLLCHHCKDKRKIVETCYECKSNIKAAKNRASRRRKKMKDRASFSSLGIKQGEKTEKKTNPKVII